MTRTEPWCARCGVALQGHDHPAGTVWRCSACLGVFVPQSQEAQLALPSRDRGARPVASGAVGCPWCTWAMGRDVVDGVELDRCITCGIWLDDGELEQLLGAGAAPQATQLQPTLRPRRRIGVLDVLLGRQDRWTLHQSVRESIEDDYRRQQHEAAKEAALLAWVATRRDAA